MIAIIAAMAQNRVIGKNGRLPWHIPGEQRRFRQLTMNNAVILGRISFEEIGRALPGRRTIVVSSRGDYSHLGCLNARSLTEALALSEGMDAFISGGASLYEEALPLAEKLFLTEIHAAFAGDTFFPPFDAGKYEKLLDEFIPGNPSFSYVSYTRIG